MSCNNNNNEKKKKRRKKEERRKKEMRLQKTKKRKPRISRGTQRRGGNFLNKMYRYSTSIFRNRKKIRSVHIQPPPSSSFSIDLSSSSSSSPPHSSSSSFSSPPSPTKRPLTQLIPSKTQRKERRQFLRQRKLHDFVHDGKMSTIDVQELGWLPKSKRKK
jgi:hypothetical protein